METQTKSNSARVEQKFSETFQRAQQEIEQLALQFALGKAEASEKFEEIKGDLNEKLNQWKHDWAELKSLSIAKVVALQSKLDALQVQLALGKAEARLAFEEQKKNILRSVTELETEIYSHPELRPFLNEFKNEIEKTKLKFEILKLKFELKSFEITDSFKEEMVKAKIQADKVLLNAGEKWDQTKEKFSDFRDEIEIAFNHLKNAIAALK